MWAQHQCSFSHFTHFVLAYRFRKYTAVTDFKTLLKVDSKALLSTTLHRRRKTCARSWRALVTQLHISTHWLLYLLRISRSIRLKVSAARFLKGKLSGTSKNSGQSFTSPKTRHCHRWPKSASFEKTSQVTSSHSIAVLVCEKSWLYFLLPMAPFISVPAVLLFVVVKSLAFPSMLPIASVIPPSSVPWRLPKNLLNQLLWVHSSGFGALVCSLWIASQSLSRSSVAFSHPHPKVVMG